MEKPEFAVLAESQFNTENVEKKKLKVTQSYFSGSLHKTNFYAMYTASFGVHHVYLHTTCPRANQSYPRHVWHFCDRWILWQQMNIDIIIDSSHICLLCICLQWPSCVDCHIPWVNGYPCHKSPVTDEGGSGSVMGLGLFRNCCCCQPAFFRAWSSLPILLILFNSIPSVPPYHRCKR